MAVILCIMVGYTRCPVPNKIHNIWGFEAFHGSTVGVRVAVAACNNLLGVVIIVQKIQNWEK